MPVLIDRAPSGRTPTLPSPAERVADARERADAGGGKGRGPERFLELGLVNNMPDAALESTERQFLELLRAAAVRHMDGVRRQALDEKRFGVFECTKVSDHVLLAGVPVRARIAHSRWNELPEHALKSCGYTILTQSPEAGVDAFVKQRQSLFVFFQGHPEYDERALLREYRRDIGRFLRGERESSPALPRRHFD